MARYAFTIFVSAFLLFQVQPMIAKYVLPWFGGGPAIWTSCMLFFQTMLLGGYLYAHLLSVNCSIKKQSLIHMSLLLVSLALLPIAPSDSLRPEGAAAPVAGILLLLFATVGGPYFLLSSTGPLMQRWFSRSFPGRSPYRLYSLSNIGSMLALLSYPFSFEPQLRLRNQVWIWSGVYAVFVALACWCAWLVRNAEDEPDEPDEPAVDATTSAEGPIRRPTFGLMLLWLALSATGSTMLLATTNQMCIDVAVVPFLWILPLVLYLLSFVICFDNPRWYDRRVFGLLLVVASVGACWQMNKGLDTSIVGLVSIYSLVLGACCMTCHGELVALRPSPRYLTLFYLMVSIGGAIGGLLVAVVAPAVFTGFWEYQVALGAVVVVTAIAWCANATWKGPHTWTFWAWAAASAAQVVAVYKYVYYPDALGFDPTDSAWLFIGTGAIQLGGLIAVADQERRPNVIAIITVLVTALQLGWAHYTQAGEPYLMAKLVTVCSLAGLIGCLIPRLERLASATVKNVTAALGFELIVVLAIAVMWQRELATDLGRIVALDVYLALVIYGAFFGLFSGFVSKEKSIKQTMWHLAAAGLALFLMAAETLGNLQELKWLGDFHVGFLPLPSMSRNALLGGIWGMRAVGTVMPRAALPIEGGIWFWAPLGAACAMLTVSLGEIAWEDDDDVLHISRNFYGVLKVSKLNDDVGDHYSLTHGQIEHGVQYIDEEWRMAPTTYYGPGTGVEMALRLHPRRLDGKNLRVGVVGLGTGSVAANGVAGDHFRFYEINPAVAALSAEGKFFTYLKDSPAETEVVLGDARVMLDREWEENGSQKFDAMVIDAFSSDSIPVHLLTRECADVYQRHLKEDGLLVIHISNRFLDLNPITKAMAEHLNWQAVRIDSDDDSSIGVYGSTWIILTANQEFVNDPEVSAAHWAWDDDTKSLLWTDDFASLWQIMSY